MKLSEEQWQNIANHFRSKIISLYDPTAMFIENQKLKDELNSPHKGVYVGIVDSSGVELSREGFLDEKPVNILESIDAVAQNSFSALKEKNIPLSKVKTSTCHFNIVTDVIYLPDPLKWDEDKDGVFFQWGGDFFGFYLNYQIQRMSIPKIDILDRLCSFEAKVFSSAWKLPEGLIFKLVSHSFSS